MSTQVHSTPGQTEGRKKAFLDGKAQTYPMKYILHHVGVMLTIIKVFLILFLLVRIGNILAIFKINQ